MRGKQGNEVNTRVTITQSQTLHLFLLHMYSYTSRHYSTFIVALLLDMTFTNAILYFAYCQYSEQLASQASEFVNIRVRVLYTAVFCTKEHCTIRVYPVRTRIRTVQTAN